MWWGKEAPEFISSYSIPGLRCFLYQAIDEYFSPDASILFHHHVTADHLAEGAGREGQTQRNLIVSLSILFFILSHSSTHTHSQNSRTTPRFTNPSSPVPHHSPIKVRRRKK